MRILLAALLLTACATAPTPPPPAPTADFTVVTSNIRYGTANDGPDAWPQRRHMLVDLLTAQQPAILGVQEALAAQVDFLQQHLPHHQQLGVGRDGGRKGEFSALFVDTRRFEVLDSGTFWLSPTPEVTGSVGWDAALTRICTWAQLRDREGGASLRVYNTHFDHRGGGARLHSAELIAARIAAAPGPCLLLGDFNTGEGTPPLRALREAGMRDTFRDLHPDATAVGTFHGFKGATQGNKIDYVLAGAGIETETASILSAPGPNGRWVSDHHPVLATVRLLP